MSLRVTPSAFCCSRNALLGKFLSSLNLVIHPRPASSGDVLSVMSLP